MGHLSLRLFLFLTILFCQQVFAGFNDLWESLDEAKGKERLSILREIEKKTFDNINDIINQSSLKELNATAVDPEDFFRERLKKYEKYLGDVDFKKYLKGLRDSGLDYLDKNLTEELKELRGRANKVRTAFYVFDEAHEAPEEFAKFVSNFGKLNDAIASKNNKKIKQRAEKTLELFKEIEDLSLKENFNPLSESKFRKYLESLSLKMSGMVTQKTITVEEFHVIRKDLKQIHSSYDAILSLNEIDSPTSALLGDLIEEMGKLNDVYTDIEITKLMELEDHTIKLPGMMRKNFADTLKFFQVDLCDLKFQ